ncbi:MAG TPA: potassium-transporting ATPase subunit KdpA [Micromonosporaceae bacterium]|jgi:K+-transporting ATPase ATPase A chain|nr:potassium-transporting ATPase subunit KdpA [Micromonosporaceae bacterium]
MNPTTAGILFIVTLVIALALVYKPFGDYMYRVVTGRKHSRVERVIYKGIGVNPQGEQTWGVYARAVLAFSFVSIIVLYVIQRIQAHLPDPGGTKFTGVGPALSWNTAVSFVTNTNWQAYSGESTMTYVTQMSGLAVQNFLSAAVGISVAVALVRGFAYKITANREGTANPTLGNFWVDLTRITIRILLPIAIIGAIVFVSAGMIQNFHATDVQTLAGTTQHITGGPVASQEIIKEFGTNGGGFYNANSAHPFENPTAWTNWLQVFLLLVISFSLPRTFGKMVGSNKHGYALVAAMAIMAIGSVVVINLLQGFHGGTVPQAVGAATEGTETRFGVLQSSTFASATTLTSTGAVDSFHDSYTSLGGGVPILNMMLGEVAPGGTGSGLYGLLVLAVVTVFVAGLMVGRTPEYLGKKLGAREMKFASLYFLTTPTLVLLGAGIAMASATARSSMLNTGPHGLSEVLYAFTSAANNNGSAFAGISVNTTFYNTALGLAMGLGRLLPIVFVLGLAGSLARQRPVPESAGTLPTYKPLFVGMLVGVTLIIVALTYLPALALGPLAEGLH